MTEEPAPTVVDDPMPDAICTGDTLFVGDVGRPDLLGSSERPRCDGRRGRLVPGEVGDARHHLVRE